MFQFHDWVHLPNRLNLAVSFFVVRERCVSEIAHLLVRFGNTAAWERRRIVRRKSRRRQVTNPLDSPPRERILHISQQLIIAARDSHSWILFFADRP